MANKRNESARLCQAGASNQRRVAMALVEAIDECRAENVDPSQDPACYLILHQLNWLMLGRDTAVLDEWRKAAKAVGLEDV